MLSQLWTQLCSLPALVGRRFPETKRSQIFLARSCENYWKQPPLGRITVSLLTPRFLEFLDYDNCLRFRENFDFLLIDQLTDTIRHRTQIKLCI